MQLDQIKRREFITLLGGAAAAWPLAARAQKGEQVRRVGVLMNGNERDPVYQAYVATFVRSLQQLGWLEGQNLRIDLRWPSADPERIGAYAAELVGMTPDVFLCSGSGSLAGLLRTTSSVKAVFVLVSDPVAQGFVHKLGASGRQRHRLFRVRAVYGWQMARSAQAGISPPNTRCRHL